MIKFFHNRDKFLFWLLIASAFGAIVSCSSVVDSTKKIELSRSERRFTARSAEETFLDSVVGIPLKEWKRGKRFVAPSSRSLLIFMPSDLQLEEDTVSDAIIFCFEGIEEGRALSGESHAYIVFEADNHKYRYDAGQRDVALNNVNSESIPLLIDLDMVESTNNLMKGRHLFTRSSLWYDSSGNRIQGRKFVEVEIDSVVYGDMVFPLRVYFHEMSGHPSYVYMNYRANGKESRGFSNLFYLTDPKLKYGNISDEVWENIRNGKIKNGMTKQECKLSIGNPAEVESGHDYNNIYDLWIYPDGTTVRFIDGVVVSYR